MGSVERAGGGDPEEIGGGGRAGKAADGDGLGEGRDILCRRGRAKFPIGFSRKR